MAKICFFSKINLATATKKFQDLFPAFKSQDSIQIEYV